MAPALPTWAAPPLMLPPLSATSRTMKIGMSSKNRILSDLSMIAYWTIRPQLLRCPAWPTSPSGANGSRCCRCRPIRERMAADDVTLDQVMETTADALDAGLLQFAEGSVDRHRVASSTPPTSG